MRRKLSLAVLSFIIIVSIVSITFVVSSVGNITPKADAGGPFCLAECGIYAAAMGGIQDEGLWWILFDLCRAEEGC